MQNQYRDGMYTDDDGGHWRGFARHYPSGEVYLLEQDQPPGVDGANYTYVYGPLSQDAITREELEYPIAGRRVSTWAMAQTWSPVMEMSAHA